MTEKKPHIEFEIINIFRQAEIDDRYLPKFLEYYRTTFDELYEDHKDWDTNAKERDEFVKAGALTITQDYISRFLKAISQGHCEEWAHAVSDTSEEEERALYNAYSIIWVVDPEMAKRELLIHIKTLNEDSHFEKHYVLLFENLADPDNRVEVARRYSQLFKEEIENGKSELYAHKYADLMADGESHEIYCREYAFAYESAINENRSEEYAHLYADRYGEAVVNIKARHSTSDNVEMLDFAIEKVKAFMNAWEYGRENKLPNFKRFAEIYEDIYLNKFYSENEVSESDSEAFKMEVLNEALRHFYERKDDI